jgi:hypothetical protein
MFFAEIDVSAFGIHWLAAPTGISPDD